MIMMEGIFFFFDMGSNCLYQTTSSVNFWDLTSSINGGHSSHISGNAKRCYLKNIVIIKQNCCSLQPSIFNPLFRLFHLPPTEEKMGTASATLLNLNWTITWNSIGAQCMTRHLMQVHKNAPQHWLKEIKGNPAILSLKVYHTGHEWWCRSWLEKVNLTVDLGGRCHSFTSHASHSTEKIESILYTYLFIWK